jgi:hypothetical protein
MRKIARDAVTGRPATREGENGRAWNTISITTNLGEERPRDRSGSRLEKAAWFCESMYTHSIAIDWRAEREPQFSQLQIIERLRFTLGFPVAAPGIRPQTRLDAVDLAASR